MLRDKISCAAFLADFGEYYKVFWNAQNFNLIYPSDKRQKYGVQEVVAYSEAFYINYFLQEKATQSKILTQYIYIKIEALRITIF